MAGLFLTMEVEVFLATHGWWPWLLTYAVLLAVIVVAVVYFVRRRRGRAV